MSDIQIRFSVDDDWKARVQREREEALGKTAEKETPTRQSGAEASASSVPDVKADQATDVEMHPAFEALVNMLATQAMYCLGFIGAPGQGQVVVNLDQAKDIIDMLIMLRDKTIGNLAPSEQSVMTETLAEIQRLFAARVQQAQTQAMQQAGIDPANLRGAQ